MSIQPPPRAIVIGLDSMTGLQTARILARHGIPVIGITRNLRDPLSRTSVCEKILACDTSANELIDTLTRLGPALEQKAVLYPCRDLSVLHISRHRDELRRWYYVALPEPQVVEMLINKISFYDYARKSGLLIPATFLLHNREDAECAAESLTFPCILKPPFRAPDWEKNAATKVYAIHSRKDFLPTYDNCAKWGTPLLAQEWIEGGDENLYSCNCYFDANSKPLVTFIARKLRQWPPGAGTSTLGEECRNDTVLKQTVDLFQAVGLRGLGYLEMKLDARTGKYFIIEPNIGRPTGRSAIAEAGGVDLLFTMYCNTVGWPMTGNREQMYRGVKWVYLRRDLQSALYSWRHGQLTLRSWAKSLRGKKTDAVFAWNDPLPFWFDITNTVTYAFRVKTNGRAP